MAIQLLMFYIKVCRYFFQISKVVVLDYGQMISNFRNTMCLEIWTGVKIWTTSCHMQTMGQMNSTVLALA